MNESWANPEMRDLAKRPVDYEVAPKRTFSDNLPPACQKLRLLLSSRTGTAGCRSLLTHALISSKREAPVPSAALVNDNGSLEGLSIEAAQADTVLITHLISLLVRSIRNPIDKGPVHDNWTDVPGLGRSSGRLNS